MINPIPNIPSEAFDPINEEKTSEYVERLKEIGLKGFTPLLNVVRKHKGDLNPYFVALETALKAGVETLGHSSASSADQTVASWFSESAAWVSELKNKIDSTHTQDLLNFLEEEASKRPGLMFAASYVVGLAFGRAGRHLGHSLTDQEDTIH